MKLVHSLRNPRLRKAGVAIALAAGLGAATLGTVAALAQAAPDGRAPMDAMHHGPGRGMDWVKTKLKLTPSQQALFDAAQAKMRPPEGARAHMREAHQRYMDALMDPSFDPRKWLAEQDQERAEREAQMKEARTAWLALWDSLDASQRTQVREMLVSQAHHRGMHADWRPLGGHDGDGDPAMPHHGPGAAPEQTRPGNQ